MSATLNIVRPNLSLQNSAATAPVAVTIQAPALFQLLEFALRSQERIIGTLVGARSDDGDELEVKDCYIVPHNISDDALEIEEMQMKTQYQLHKRSNPRDVILGWFSTSDEIDSFTSLIHDFYSKSEPHSLIHLTLPSLDEIKEIPTVTTYLGTLVGASMGMSNSLKLDKDPNFIFTPIANKINFDAQERSVLNYASKAVNSNTDVAELTSQSVDLQVLSESLVKIDALIDSTLEYITKVEQGTIKGDDKLAKLLLSSLNTNVQSLQLEDAFTQQIQDSLMVEYLTSSVKTQLELSAKLATL